MAEKTHRVVVLDDDPDARALIRASLEPDGFEVLTAADVGTGLALVRRERPDVVLVDYLLPDGDGLEVCRRIDGEPGLSGVLPILLTGKEDLDPDAVRAAGAAGSIGKPFRPDRLGSKIRELLR